MGHATHLHQVLQAHEVDARQLVRLVEQERDGTVQVPEEIQVSVLRELIEASDCVKLGLRARSINSCIASRCNLDTPDMVLDLGKGGWDAELRNDRIVKAPSAELSELVSDPEERGQQRGALNDIHL